MNSFNAFIFELKRHKFAGPAFLIALLAMIMLPLPPVLLDVLFTFNIVLALGRHRHQDHDQRQHDVEREQHVQQDRRQREHDHAQERDQENRSGVLLALQLRDEGVERIHAETSLR